MNQTKQKRPPAREHTDTLCALCVRAMINLPLSNTREIISSTKAGKNPGNIYMLYITLLDNFLKS